MSRDGFTLVELLIALALIAMLAGLMVPLGARLGSSTTRIDASLRQEDALARVLDMIESSLIASDLGTVRFSRDGMTSTPRIITPGASDSLASIGAARKGELVLTDGTLVFSESATSVVVVEGVRAIEWSARSLGEWTTFTNQIPSQAGALRLRVWFEGNTPDADNPEQTPIPNAERVFILTTTPGKSESTNSGDAR